MPRWPWCCKPKPAPTSFGWVPHEDITAYEAAVGMEFYLRAVLTMDAKRFVERLEKLPANVRRHFVVTVR